MSNTKHLFFVGLFALVLSQALFSSTFAAQIYTEGASEIGQNTATVNAYIHVGYTTDYPTVWFEWGTNPDTPLPNSTSHKWDKGNFYYKDSISNLSPDTLYFFRVVAQDTIDGITYGDVNSFRTEKNIQGQVVSNTNSAYSINESSAMVGCFADPEGSTDMQRWVEWGGDVFVGNKTEKIYQGSVGSYSVFLSGLSQNTVYYFRCASSAGQSGTVYGNTLNFTTRAVSYGTGGGNSGNGNVFISPIAITRPATDITEAGVRLNATALPGGSNIQTSGWFQWGRTPDLGQMSVKRYLGVGNSFSFGEILLGLVPGTTYFFKPVIENGNGTAEGTLFSFHTAGVSPEVSSLPIIDNSNKAALITVYKKQIQNIVQAPIGEQKTIRVDVIPNTDTVAPKEKINETIQLENITGNTLKDVMVRVILPNEASYLSTGGDGFIESGKILTYKISEMKPKEKSRLLFWLEIGADVPDKTLIETIAVVTWEDKTRPKDAESIGRATVTADKNKIIKENSLAAAGAVKSDSFFSFSRLKDYWSGMGIFFLLLAAYMVFLMTRQKKEYEWANVPLKKEDETVIQNIPVIDSRREKGIPPDNLPV